MAALAACAGQGAAEAAVDGLFVVGRVTRHDGVPCRPGVARGATVGRARVVLLRLLALLLIDAESAL